jgi:hypothetical protein
MKKLIGISLFIVCAICLGACANMPSGDTGSAPDYGSSTPR